MKRLIRIAKAMDSFIKAFKWPSSDWDHSIRPPEFTMRSTPTAATRTRRKRWLNRRNGWRRMREHCTLSVHDRVRISKELYHIYSGVTG